ncbi:hypothetical protein RRG08_011003 [Elysia crispata]|uniref:Uncharacterized protein n=1 Tax=Elysia crispata TaxID=231223 RepID=A0AAE0ZQR7_9GAST|nr:hypothetical protein RRG08_011003 [Elysia crispata]
MFEHTAPFGSECSEKSAAFCPATSAVKPQSPSALHIRCALSAATDTKWVVFISLLKQFSTLHRCPSLRVLPFSGINSNHFFLWPSRVYIPAEQCNMFFITFVLRFITGK